MKRLLCLLIVPMILFTSCSILNIFNKKVFVEISAPLKVIPDDLNNPDGIRYSLVETIDGKEKKIFTPFSILNPQYTNPIFKVGENNYFVFYPWNSDIYEVGTGKLSPYHKPYDDKSLRPQWDADNTSEIILYTMYNQAIDNYLNVNMSSNPWERSKINQGDYIPPASVRLDKNNNDSYKDRTFADIGYGKDEFVFKSKKLRAELKEQYTHIFASASKKYLYYDNIDNEFIPKIYRIKVGDYQKNATVFKPKAFTPVVSSDETFFAYNYNENATFLTESDCETIIEKNNKIVKRFESKRIILMDEEDKEIYSVNPKDNTLEVFDMDKLDLKFVADLDKGFIFLQIINGKLQYTCPKYENNKIVNYIVKEEGK